MKLTDSQKWLVLASCVVTGWLLYLLAPVLTPFLLAALFAYLGDPAVDWLQRHKLSRTVSVVVVFLVMTVIVVVVFLLLLPIAQRQLVLLIEALPGYLDWASEHVLPWISEKTGITPEQLELRSMSGLLQQHWSEAGGIARNVIGYISQSGAKLFAWVANLVLIPVVTFYLLRDWDVLVDRLNHLLPRQLEPEITRVVKDADFMLGAFLRGQILVMVSLGTIYGVGLWLAGVKFALLIGMLAGVVSFVPYLGFIVGVLVAGMAVLFQTHDALALIPVLGVFAVGQALEGMLLTPLLVGDRIGLHPVLVIFAVLAGAQLFGFVGMLIALPAAAVLAVVVRDLHRRYVESAVYKEAKD